MEVIPLCPGGENGKHAAFKLQSFGLRVRVSPGILTILSRINKTKPYESNDF